MQGQIYAPDIPRTVAFSSAVGPKFKAACCQDARKTKGSGPIIGDLQLVARVERGFGSNSGEGGSLLQAACEVGGEWLAPVACA